MERLPETFFLLFSVVFVFVFKLYKDKTCVPQKSCDVNRNETNGREQK